MKEVTPILTHLLGERERFCSCGQPSSWMEYTGPADGYGCYRFLCNDCVDPKLAPPAYDPAKHAIVSE